MKVGIGFILIGGFFVVSLLFAIGELLFKTDWDKEKFTASKVLSIFKWTIVGFIALVLFVYALRSGYLE